MVFLKGVAIWGVIILAEMLHGTARVLFLQPYVGDFRARQIAVFTGSGMILALAYATVRWLGATRRASLLGVGVLWLVLTLAFELFLGRVLLGYSWQRIGSDYNLLAGGLLPFGLLVLTTAPLLAAKWRGILQ